MYDLCQQTIKEIDIEEEQGIINVETLTEPEHKMMEEKCCQFENELPDDDSEFIIFFACLMCS